MNKNANRWLVPDAVVADTVKRRRSGTALKQLVIELHLQGYDIHRTSVSEWCRGLTRRKATQHILKGVNT